MPAEAPDVVQPLQSVTAKDGDHVQFQCVIVGNPQPDIAWFHSGKLKKPSAEFRQVYDAASGVCCLDINEAFPEDTGRYTVVARNFVGSATSSADLNVRENEDLRGAAWSNLILLIFVLLTSNIVNSMNRILPVCLVMYLQYIAYLLCQSSKHLKEDIKA